jgi:ABC-type multidrug transport system permease subunit
VRRSDFLSAALGVAWRVLHNVFTNPSYMIPQFVFPLFFFTAFAGGLSQLTEVPGFDEEYSAGYTSFQFVFVFLQSAAFGGVFTGFGIARDFESGFTRRLLVAVPRRSAIIVGYAMAAFVRWGATGSMLFIVGLVAGMEIGGNGVDLFALVVLALLVNASTLLWAAGVAMRLRTMQAGPMMQLPVFLTLFFAPVYVPLALLEGWMEAVASVNPVTQLLEAGRGFVSGEHASSAAAFGVGVGLVCLFSLWAVRGLRRAEAAGGS